MLMNGREVFMIRYPETLMRGFSLLSQPNPLLRNNPGPCYSCLLEAQRTKSLMRAGKKEEEGKKTGPLF
jgi:hypothetical protein